MLRSRRFWIGTSVSLVFIALLLWKTNPQQLWDSWRHADYRWLLLAIAIEMFGILVRALRWRYILLSRVDLSALQLFPVLVIGYMANNVLPARAGELVRAYVLGERYRVSKMFALGTVAVERLFDGLALLGILLATALTLGVDSVLRDLALVMVVVFAVALAIFVIVLASPKRSEALALWLVSLTPQRFHERASELALAFLSGLGALRHPRLLGIVAVTSIAAWMIEGLVFEVIAHALGINPGYGYSLMAMSAANLAITAPSSQGGIGPYEFFAARAVILTGVSASAAAAFALAAHAVIILPVTALGFIYLWKINLSLSQMMRREQAAPLLDEQAALPEA